MHKPFTAFLQCNVWNVYFNTLLFLKRQLDDIFYNTIEYCM